MILLFSSAALDVYREFVLQLLCYPNDHILTEVPYSYQRVEGWKDDQVDSVAARLRWGVALKNQEALIVLVDYHADANGAPKVRYVPMRSVKIVDVKHVAKKLVLSVRLGDFLYYTESVRNFFTMPSTSDPPDPRDWSSVVAKFAIDAPHAVPSDAAVPMQYIQRNTWKSDGYFIREINSKNLSLNELNATVRDVVRTQHDDWVSVVDMVSNCKLLDDKLFYRVEFEGAKKPQQTRQFPSSTVYELVSDGRIDVVLNFYPGKNTGVSQRQLEITTDQSCLSAIGTDLIRVYPNQPSGKTERLQLVVKRRLSQEFARFVTRERPVLPETKSALASIELYFLIKARTALIGLMIFLFFAGTFLNAMPEAASQWSCAIITHSHVISNLTCSQLPHRGTDGVAWVSKVLGSGLIAWAFFLGFSKLPSANG